MANPLTITNEINELYLGNNEFEDVTILSGENAAKNSVLGEVLVAADSITADTGNTGDGTFDSLALASGGPAKIGTWVVECVEAVTNGGVFKLTDPDGIVVKNDITIPAGAGNDVTFTGAGITFKITDGSTDFVVGDHADIVIAEGSHKMRVVNSNNVDGSQIPRKILPVAVDASSGDLASRAVISGSVRESLLVFGGSDTIDTVFKEKTYREWLRDFSIVTVDDVVNDRVNP